MRGPFWLLESDGVIVSVRLTPKGGRDAIEGVLRLADGQSVLKARVRAPPREGEANRALVQLFARALEIPGADVRIVAGTIGRLKRVKIQGNGPVLAARLEVLAAEHGL